MRTWHQWMRWGSGPPVTERGHRLDSEAHTWFKENAGTSLSVVGNRRVLMESPPDAVSYEVPNNSKPFGLADALDGMADIAQPRARSGPRQRHIKSPLGHVKQLLDWLGSIPEVDRES